MKARLAVAIYFIALFVVFAFVNLQVNPLAWDYSTRLGFSVFFLAGTVIAIMAYHIDFDKV